MLLLSRSAAQVCGCKCDESIHGIRAFGDNVTLPMALKPRRSQSAFTPTCFRLILAFSLMLGVCEISLPPLFVTLGLSPLSFVLTFERSNL